MPDLSPRLGLPYILPSQNQKHVTHNEALRLLDALVQLRIASFDAITPPTGAQSGETHSVGPGATGAWTGQEGRLATFEDNGWSFFDPVEGWRAADLASGALRVFRSGAWVNLLDEITTLGIGATADATNRLAVAAAATLLTHDGAGHQLKINKAQTADTASLLYQSDWSGRAELGLAGSDSLSIKVSPDGSAWTTALSFDPATGTVAGAAVQSGVTDHGAGKLMRADYGYGPGNVTGIVSEAGGLPTGAVLECGENSNGHYLRLACGTQICWSQGTSGTAWFMPAAFAGTASDRMILITAAGNAPTMTSCGNNTTNGCKPRLFDDQGTEITGATLYCAAVGRWY